MMKEEQISSFFGGVFMSGLFVFLNFLAGQIQLSHSPHVALRLEAPHPWLRLRLYTIESQPQTDTSTADSSVKAFLFLKSALSIRTAHENVCQPPGDFENYYLRMFLCWLQCLCSGIVMVHKSRFVEMNAS